MQQVLMQQVSDQSPGQAMTSGALEISSPVGLIAAGGVMPFAVADSLIARGLDPVLFALRGACDPERVKRFRHHWISVGQLGRAVKLFPRRKLPRPGFHRHAGAAGASEIRLDWGTLRVIGPILGGVPGRRRSSAVRDRPHPRTRRFPHGRDQGCRARPADARGMSDAGSAGRKCRRRYRQGTRGACGRSARSISARPRS